MQSIDSTIDEKSIPDEKDKVINIEFPDNDVKESKDDKGTTNNETALGDNKDKGSTLSATQIPIDHKREANEHGLSASQFTINITKSALGLSALAVPLAVSKVGIIVAIVFYVFVCICYYYASHVLIKLKQYYTTHPVHMLKEKKTNSEYTLITYYLMGDWGYYLITAALLVTLWGCNVGTMITLTDFCSQFPWASLGVTLSNSTIRVISCAIMTVLGIFFLLLKDTTLLVCISGFGLFALVLTFAILFINGGISYGFSFQVENLFPSSIPDLLANIGVFISSTSFTFMLFPLYNDMKLRSKRYADKSIGVSMTILCLIYIVTGIPLFLSFQNDPVGIQGNIALNLDKTSISSIIISVSMLISCLGNYPLQFLGILEILEAGFQNKTTNRLFVTDKNRILCRVIQAIIISIISLYVPYFSKVFGIIGAFTISITGIIIPVLLNLLWSHRVKKPLTTSEYIFDYILLIIFTIIMFICTYYSVMDLVESLINDS